MPDSFQLQSSNLAGGTYDTETRELVIEFASGAQYAYDGVPAEVVEELKTAPSAGSYFQRWIRDRYATRRLS